MGFDQDLIKRLAQLEGNIEFDAECALGKFKVRAVAEDHAYIENEDFEFDGRRVMASMAMRFHPKQNAWRVDDERPNPLYEPNSNILADKPISDRSLSALFVSRANEELGPILERNRAHFLEQGLRSDMRRYEIVKREYDALTERIQSRSAELRQIDDRDMGEQSGHMHSL